MAITMTAKPTKPDVDMHDKAAVPAMPKNYKGKALAIAFIAALILLFSMKADASQVHASLTVNGNTSTTIQSSNPPILSSDGGGNSNNTAANTSNSSTTANSANSKKINQLVPASNTDANPAAKNNTTASENSDFFKSGNGAVLSQEITKNLLAVSVIAIIIILMLAILSIRFARNRKRPEPIR